MADELKPQLIVFHTGGTVVAEIEEVGADIGEPDCKLINPYNICLLYTSPSPRD